MQSLQGRPSRHAQLSRIQLSHLYIAYTRRGLQEREQGVSGRKSKRLKERVNFATPHLIAKALLKMDKLRVSRIRVCCQASKYAGG